MSTAQRFEVVMEYRASDDGYTAEELLGLLREALGNEYDIKWHSVTLLSPPSVREEPPTYDRDKVRRLENEIKDEGNNRFVGLPNSESNSVSFDAEDAEPEKCPTCNGYHRGGCHRAQTAKEGKPHGGH